MKQITLFLSAFLYLISSQFAMAQYVSVTYKSENHSLTIENHSGQEIIIFSNEVKKDDDNVFEPNSFKKYVEPSGVSFSNYYMTLRYGKTHTFEHVNSMPERIVYFEYQIIDDKYALTNKKEIWAKDFTGDVTIKSEENTANTNTEDITQPVQNSTQETNPVDPEKQAKPKVTKAKPSPPPVVVNPYREKIEKLFNDSKDKIDKGKGGLLRSEEDEIRRIEKKAIVLRKDIENDKIALEKKKTNKKTKCNDCDELIKFAKESLIQIDMLTGKIHVLLASMTDRQIVEIKLEYWNEVLTTAPQDTLDIQFIKTEIERRNKHYLWGWIGISKIKNILDEVSINYEQIKEESTLFIQQKLVYYSDHDDRSVIHDLVNEIPTEYKDIEEYESELNYINVPYAMLSLIGIVFVLLLAGVAVYLKAVIANKKSKKIEQENRISGKSGLLIEDDDTIEVISYHVGLNDIKEHAEADYYPIQMDTILEDTTIRTVYLSRKAILDIYKFFFDFSKYNGKINETGCFLVGRWEHVPYTAEQRYDISIENIVEPSDDAVYGEYNLNFGAKIGITLNFVIEKLCEKTGNEYVHTAWMHSHPGLGLFLSSQDLSVQSQLAHSQHQGRMLAIVLDTNTPDLKMAFFTPKENGTMNNDKDVKLFLSLETLYQWAKMSEP